MHTCLNEFPGGGGLYDPLPFSCVRSHVRGSIFGTFAPSAGLRSYGDDRRPYQPETGPVKTQNVRNFAGSSYLGAGRAAHGKWRSVDDTCERF